MPNAEPPKRLTTNQLQYIQASVVKALFAHEFSWPFRVPVDPVKLGIPVRAAIRRLGAGEGR